MPDEEKHNSHPEPPKDEDSEKDKGDKSKGSGVNISNTTNPNINAGHATITINQITHVIGERSIPEDVFKKYHFGASDPTFTPDEKTKEAVKEMPVSDEQFDEWFFSRLSAFEQCFVLTMAVFYGTAASVVTDAAYRLYTALRELEKQKEKQELSQVESMPRIASTQLLRKLFIVRQRISGTERLYWQDTDENGDSEFGTRLLLYIAREATYKFGAHEIGLIFDQQLLIWVNDKYEDRDIAWRATRALGAFWWQDRTEEIGDAVNQWVNSKEPFDRHRAAWCLDGAYKIDKIECQETADDIKKVTSLKEVA